MSTSFSPTPQGARPPLRVERTVHPLWYHLRSCPPLLVRFCSGCFSSPVTSIRPWVSISLDVTICWLPLFLYCCSHLPCFMSYTSPHSYPPVASQGYRVNVAGTLNVLTILSVPIYRPSTCFRSHLRPLSTLVTSSIIEPGRPLLPRATSLFPPPLCSN